LKHAPQKRKKKTEILHHTPKMTNLGSGNLPRGINVRDKILYHVKSNQQVQHVCKTCQLILILQQGKKWKRKELYYRAWFISEVIYLFTLPGHTDGLLSVSFYARVGCMTEHNRQKICLLEFTFWCEKQWRTIS
jgi:hypothetical protein